jgi:hypothetical protein
MHAKVLSSIKVVRFRLQWREISGIGLMVARAIFASEK